MKLSNLLPLLALAVASPASSQVCPYQNLMPEFARFVATTGGLAPPARAEAFVERFAAKHPDYYSEQMFGSRQKLTERAQRLFDPQRAPKFQGTRPLTMDDILATGRSVTWRETLLTSAPESQCAPGRAHSRLWHPAPDCRS